jgi:hypothetical protein
VNDLVEHKKLIMHKDKKFIWAKKYNLGESEGIYNQNIWVRIVL